MSAGTWELQGTLGNHSKTLCGESERERGGGRGGMEVRNIGANEVKVENGTQGTQSFFHHVGRNGILSS